MTRSDMSPRAVTIRLVRTAQLRRLCLELRRRSIPQRGDPSPTDRAADEIAAVVSEAQERYRGSGNNSPTD